MKYVKMRGSPTLSRLLSSTQLADMAINSAVADAATPNRRFSKHRVGRLGLAQLLAEMPTGLPVNQAGESLTPVGQEVVECNQPTANAVAQLRDFMGRRLLPTYLQFLSEH